MPRERDRMLARYQEDGNDLACYVTRDEGEYAYIEANLSEQAEQAGASQRAAAEHRDPAQPYQ